MGSPTRGHLLYVDQHRVQIPASRATAWTALHQYVAASLSGPRHTPLRRALGTEPPAGFEVSERVPEERLTLTGRHRFSRYRLEFALVDAVDGTTELKALTYAAFPGLRGTVYRTLVIGSRAHVVATNHILRSIRRLSLEVAAETPG